MNYDSRYGVFIVDEFRPEKLPVASISRLMVHIIDDGFGHPIRVPMLVARGRREGPVFGLTAAIHGNELNGIPLIHKVFERLDVHHLRGTVAAVLVANVPAYRNNERRMEEGADLNHIFPGVSNGNTPQVYAHRLLNRIVRSFDVLVDLHTASSGRVNSLYVRADMTHQRVAEMAYILRPEIIVHNPPGDRTLRGAAQMHDIPAVTLEIGNPQRFHREYIKRAYVGLRALLARFGHVPKRKQSKKTEAPVLCSRSYWVYTDQGGLLEVSPQVTERVHGGQVVAKIVDIFGTPTCEYQAPEAGVVIGHSVNPVAKTGARILHLGILAPDTHTYHLPQEA